jgi:hypothetical protein
MSSPVPSWRSRPSEITVTSLFAHSTRHAPPQASRRGAISIERTRRHEIVEHWASDLSIVQPPLLDGLSDHASVRFRGAALSVDVVVERGNSYAASNEREDCDNNQDLDQCHATRTCGTAS